MWSALFGPGPDPARRRSDLPEPPPRAWPRLWWPGVAVGAVALLSLALVPPDSAADDFVYLVASLTALVVLLGAILTMAGRSRPIWWSLLAFAALTMTAIGVAAVEEAQTGSVRFPGPADVVSLAAYLPAFLALGLLIHRLYPGRDREAWIDASILTVTAACVFGLFLITPLAADSGFDGWAAAVALAYPVLDLALLSALVWLLVGTSRPSLTLVLITLSFAATLAADIARDALFVVSSEAGPADWLEIVRLAALLILAAAAWTPEAESLTRPQARARRSASTGRLAVLALGVLTVPAIVVVRLRTSDDSGTLLLALAGMIVIILAVWRIQILVSTVERQRKVTELVLDSTGDGIVGLDRQGFVLFANLSARRMLRCRENDLIGHRFHDIAHHEHADGTPFPWQECPVHASLTGDEAAYLAGQWFVRRDGTGFPVEIVTSPLVIDGEPVGAVQSFRDVSEREEMEALKRQFVSVVSHELRTPLTSIKGSLQLLDSGVLGNLTEDQQELVTMAVTNSERLGTLVNDILDLERLDSDRMPLHPVPVAANELAVQAVHGVTGAATAAGIRLEADLDDADTTVEADPDRLNQVLTNLLGNAIKFSERNSVVRVVVRRTESMVTLAVQDSGRGIPADHLESVFERFGQVDAGDARREGGTGLGLAIAREIARRSGGDITVTSALGVGSTFTVTLPLAAPATDADAEPAADNAVERVAT
jgi:PAS domain S-box-containing protein